MQTLSLIDRDNLAERLSKTKQEIVEACEKDLRHVDEITLIAVSKGQDFAKILFAYELGQRDFGENYPQELAQKIKLAREHNLHEIRWHFIGAIQTNKIKIIKDAHVVHSVGSVKHAQALHQASEKGLPILLQVNLDQSAHRQGFLASELILAIEKISAFDRLSIAGLMTIAPHETNELPAEWFSRMALLKQDLLRRDILKSVTLSMGMSDDFTEAISYGANLVRIGTKIFGSRK